MTLEILQPGLQTTVQDEGRLGLYAGGMPPSGAMDKASYRMGNLLVGNPDGLASLEITYLGPEIAFRDDAVIAVTGAQMTPKVNGEPIANWRSHAVRADDVLSFGFIESGARAYLAVAGGIDVPPYDGSRSTYTLCGLGGFEGRALQAGDVVPVGTGVDGRAGLDVPVDLQPDLGGDTELRVVVGLASYRLQPESLETFLTADWTVTPDANRVGYRFRGAELHFVEREQPAGAGSDPANVVDFGYPIGSIQIPGGVEPIALLADAVTGGGYATIATIISTDLDRIGQSKTNDHVRFREVTLEDALEARHQARARLDRVRALLTDSQEHAIG
ncbi:5-oxoprolinase subunit C family protein [Capillimicrobium parvum]|uniref:5-oxoprolinase subunit C n=1 Tax=Capillimicrobium parvum TaxID=2884022 RepID=A0A9E6XWW3_9ACTN|nr:biotin-dependent carboxyltransferase family protein [Capillimicrobium parvum]UGS35949.1 5-oxoprolinase subunit C [Capillimicrobium parvum]